MNRSSFITKLVAAAGTSALPVKWVKTYDQFYLQQSFIAGFQYYKGIGLLKEFKEGDMLQLVREPENEYDSEAIALHWNGHKLGFIPASVNCVFAKLLDIQALELHAEITHLAHRVSSWENVAIAIYCLKERSIGGELPAAAKNLTMYATPEYFTIKTSDKVISRIKQGAKEEKVIINIYKLPARFNRIKEKYSTEKYLEQDTWFGEKGFRVLEEEDIEEFLPAVREVREVIDSLKQSFTEIVLDVEEMIRP